MNEHLDQAATIFKELESFSSNQALSQGLQEVVKALWEIDSRLQRIERNQSQIQEARSAVDILTNDELAQAIIDLRESLQAFQAGSSSSFQK